MNFQFGKSLAEIGATEYPPIRWAVEDLLPAGLAYLGGRPKAGKSFLLLQLVQSIAASGKFCGRTCITGDVLGLFLEDNERRIKKRWRDDLGYTSFPDRARIVSMADNFPKIGEGAEEALDAWRKSVSDPRLIIIDTGQRLNPNKPSKQNQYVQDHALLERLQRFANIRDLCVIVVGHTTKTQGDDPFNDLMATGIPAVADSLAVFRRKPLAQEAQLFVKGRDVEDIEIALERDGAAWREASNPEVIGLSLGKRRLVIWLQDHPGIHSPGEIGTALSMPHDTAKKFLRELEDDGVIHRPQYGRYEWVG